MSSNRLPYFPFHVDDYLNDPAVLGMDADAEGLYIRLLCRSWRSPDPGRIPEALVPEMCGLHRLSEQYRFLWGDNGLDVVGGHVSGPENIGNFRAKEVLDQMAAAFDTSEEGMWVQRRMVAEWRRIGGLKKCASEAGRKSAEVRKLRTTVQRPFNDRSTIVEVDLEEKRSEKAFDSVPVSGSGQVNGQVNPVRKRTVKIPYTEPGPAFWNRVDVQDALRRVGGDNEDCRALVLKHFQNGGMV